MSGTDQSAIRVSTIIPAYNSAATIARAIDSALAQGFDGQEIIVVNDGSTDNTAEALASYGERIRVIHQANGGAAAARNAGIAIAGGEYIAFLDADDEWLPGHLFALLDALAANPEAVLAFGDFTVVDERRATLLESIFAADLSGGHAPSMDEMLDRTWPILPSATAVKTNAVRQCGGFDEGFKAAGGEDFYLWLLLRERGPFVAVPRLLAVRVDPPQLVPEKYLPGNRRFLNLARARYGRKAAGLCRGADMYFASKFFGRSLERLKAGEFVASARDLMLAIRHSPRYVARNIKLAARLRKIASRKIIG